MRLWSTCAPRYFLWPLCLLPDQTISACVISALPAEDDRPSVAYRQAGDKYLLLEYGENVLDLALCACVFTP